MINSLDDKNAEKFWVVIQQLDPELYKIKVALHETGVNPSILVDVIRCLGNLAYGTGYGKLQIFMQAKMVTQIKGEESVEVNQQTLLLESTHK